MLGTVYTSRILSATAALTVLLNVSAPVWAYAPDSDLMKVKGYSPEVINLADRQRSRQEWREAPAAKRSPKEQFFHNIFYNNWTGGIDEFGSQVIREKD